jgi:hypothetical protein
VPGFYEKWKYLPIAPGKNCRMRQILPGSLNPSAIAAGTYFPPRSKIDV